MNDPGNPRRTPYFLHIPKTAGTSAISWLKEVSGLRICPHGLWSLLLKADRNSLAQYELFCGHFYRYLESYLGIPLATFTFLRNPLDRAYSHYRHVLRDSFHYYHDYVQVQGSFLAFMRDPVTQPLARNFQTRSLSAIFNPANERPPEGGGPVHDYWLEKRLETALSGLTEADELAMAKDFLHRCVFVGIAEFMEESTAILGQRLGFRGGACSKHLNRDPGVPNPWTPEEWKVVTELNRNDLLLYEYALGLFDRERHRVARQTGPQARG